MKKQASTPLCALRVVLAACFQFPQLPGPVVRFAGPNKAAFPGFPDPLALSPSETPLCTAAPPAARGQLVPRGRAWPPGRPPAPKHPTQKRGRRPELPFGTLHVRSRRQAEAFTSPKQHKSTHA